MKLNDEGLKYRFALGLAGLTSLCAVVTLVWALDKHFYAIELQKQLSQVHLNASENHDKVALLVKNNRELKSRLAACQRQMGQSGDLIEQRQSGMRIIEEPDGGVRITGK